MSSTAGSLNLDIPPASNHLVGEDGSYGPYEYWFSLWGLPELYAYGLRLLGDVQGKAVLDCGCGPGHISVMLAKRGAKVTAFDTDGHQLATAHALAKTNGVQATFLQEPFETLSLPDASYDLLFGTFVLHHVNLPQACAQIRRVLKPGGRAVFVENSALNPFLMATRRYVCGRFGIARYGDDHEHPLTRADIATLKREFPNACQVHFPNFLLFRLLDFYLFKRRSAAMTALLKSLDTTFSKSALIRRYGYLQVIQLEKST